MTRDFGDRENSRVRDLLDLVILIEHELLHPSALAPAARAVWDERNRTEPPSALPPFPASWPGRYEQMAADYDVDAATFPQAVDRVRALWAEMFLVDKE